MALAHGVTFLREMGGNIEPDWVQSLAERIEAGQLRGPHISFLKLSYRDSTAFRVSGCRSV